jgi:alpha-galactosidase
VPSKNLVRALGLVGLVLPTIVACSSPRDPLGIAYRKANAPAVTPDHGIELDAAVDTPAAAPTSSSAPDASVAEAAPPAAVETPVTDLAFVVVANGYGPAEKDMSNGEINANDGLPITLQGVAYAKGLGVHSGSEITVPLGGQYKTFVADVGVDDEVAANGSIVFQVLGDGAGLFDSGPMTGDTPTKPVSVDVTGMQELKLVVTDNGDGNASDHGDWAGARLVK